MAVRIGRSLRDWHCEQVVGLDPGAVREAIASFSSRVTPVVPSPLALRSL